MPSFQQSAQSPVIAVVGPTAAGKSGLGLDLAHELNGEIVNTDAMQVYRGMDIGTAKLPEAQRRGVPHHLLDILDVSETASVAVFQQLARAAIAECHQRGVVPVLVGGSALYTRAILDEMEFPGTDPEVRQRFENELDRLGAEVMYQRLRALDPAAAASIEAANGRRIVRALEVIEISGQPFRAQLPEPRYHYPQAVQLGVRLPREVLDARIALRVKQMWRDGLLAEVDEIEPQLRQSRTASRAIGYAQALAQLDGMLSEAEAQEKTITATRRFVRRQEAWFNKDPRVIWLDGERPDLLDQALNELRSKKVIGLPR